MSWLIDHLFGTSMFLNFTGIKYNNVISNLCHHRKVMGDIDGADPSCLITDLNAFRTSIWVVTSNAVVGSSNTRRSGFPQSAMAAISLCNCPPET